MEINELHELFLKSSGVSTDTRKIEPESIFFALKGENFNGNQFAEQALNAGAKYVVFDEKPNKELKNSILVPDTLKCLQELANYHRRFLDIPIIALTGSNGKTTTKELVQACLLKKYKTIATRGNLNNHIGVPLTLLALKKETEIGIIEMGANHPKEIDFLCKIANPDFGYITNFGKAHLEGFKSPEGVIAAKSELYDHLKANGKMLFLNYDDPIQRKQLKYRNTFSFGSNQEADFSIEFPATDTNAAISAKGEMIMSQLVGDYNSRNMAAAYSIGRYFEVPHQKLKEAIEAYTPTNNRSQVLNKGTNKIILDAYNANPTSVAAAIKTFDSIKGFQKIAILGDMFELGGYAQEEHQQLVNKLEGSSIDKIYLIGENFYNSRTREDVKKFRSFEDFTTAIEFSAINNATILIKGSRGMALERILDFL